MDDSMEDLDDSVDAPAAASSPTRPDARELRLWCLERSGRDEGYILSFTTDDRCRRSYRLATHDILAIAAAVLDDRGEKLPAPTPLQ